MVKRFVLLSVTAILLSLQAWAYNVAGRVMAGKKPAADVAVSIYDSEDNAIGNTTTDNNGYFSIGDVDADKIVAEIDDSGYVPVRIEVVTDKTDTDLGIINLDKIVELGEVTVTANRRVDAPGKTIVYVSKEDRERAAGPFNMLTILSYKAPQIEVRESERTLTIAGQETEVLVNDIKRPMSFISSIKPDAIEKIEFSTTPDVRFGKCYINIITSRPPEGGWLMADVKAALTTPRYFFSGVAQYSKGKNSFMLYYNGGYRHGRKEYIDEKEHYTGGGKDITLSVDGKPSSTIDNYHNVYFYFTRVPSDKSMFEATGGLSIHNQDRQINDVVTDLSQSYSRVNKRGGDNLSPFLSLYYNISPSETATVEIDAVGSYSHTKSYRNLSYSTGYDSQVSTTSPTWYVTTEALWKQQLPFATLNTGMNFNYTDARNKYVIDGTTSRQPLTSTSFKLYSSMSGSLWTVMYNLSAGVRYYMVENSIVRPNFSVSLQRNFGKNFALSNYLSYDPGMPPVSGYNDAVVPVNDLMYHVGAENLKSAQYVYERLQFQFVKNKFYVSAQGSISSTSNPLVTNYWYQADPIAPLAGYFIEQAANGSNYLDYGFNCSAGASNLWNILSLSASTGWNHSRLKAMETYTVCSWNLSLNMGLYWKGWQLNMTAQNVVPSWSMSSSNSMTRWWPYTLLSLYKSFGKWTLSASWGNMFSRYGGRYRSETLSAAVTRASDYRMNDQGNRIEIGVRYQLVTGKLLSKKNRSVNASGGGDNGVNWDY